MTPQYITKLVWKTHWHDFAIISGVSIVIQFYFKRRDILIQYFRVWLEYLSFTSSVKIIILSASMPTKLLMFKRKRGGSMTYLVKYHRKLHRKRVWHLHICQNMIYLKDFFFYLMRWCSIYYETFILLKMLLFRINMKCTFLGWLSGWWSEDGWLSTTTEFP